MIKSLILAVVVGVLAVGCSSAEEGTGTDENTGNVSEALCVGSGGRCDINLAPFQCCTGYTCTAQLGAYKCIKGR